jgi:hypothetical protein
MQTSHLGSRARLCCALVCVFALGCSGNRDDNLGTSKNPAEVDSGQATVPEPPAPPAMPEGAPARNAQLGVSGGKTSSSHYRARVVLNFPQASSTNRAPHYQAHLTRGGQP